MPNGLDFYIYLLPTSKRIRWSLLEICSRLLFRSQITPLFQEFERRRTFSEKELFVNSNFPNSAMSRPILHHAPTCLNNYCMFLYKQSYIIISYNDTIPPGMGFYCCLQKHGLRDQRSQLCVYNLNLHIAHGIVTNCVQCCKELSIVLSIGYFG